MAANSGFRYPYDIHATLDPWRQQLGEHYDDVVAHLADRDRSLEDFLTLWLSRYSVRAAVTANVALVAGAFTKIPFNKQLWADQSGLFSTSTNAYTAPKSGLYDVTATVPVLINGTPHLFIGAVFVNGTRTLDGNVVDVRGGTVNDEWGTSMAGQLQLVTGDVVDIRVFSTLNTSTDTFISDSSYSFCIRRNGPPPPP